MIYSKRTKIYSRLLPVMIMWVAVLGYGLSLVFTVLVKNEEYIQVSDEYVVSYAATTINDANHTPFVVNLFQNSKPELVLYLIGATFFIFLLIIVSSIYRKQGNIWALLVMFINSLLNRNLKYGGIIFDSANQTPIAFAAVKVLQKQSGEDNAQIFTVVESGITDLEGRYQLNQTPSRNLVIEVKALGYEKVIKSLTNNLDIALNKTTETVKVDYVLAINKIKLFIALRLITLILSIYGFVIAIYNQAVNSNITNLLLIAIYSTLLILVAYPSLYLLFLKRIFLFDTNEKKLKGVVVRIYQNNQLLDLDLTNSNGAAQFNLAEGNFNIICSKLGFESVKTYIEFKEEGSVTPQILLNSKSIEDPDEDPLDLHDQVMQSNREKFNLS